MIRAIQIMAFLSLSAALHAAVALQLPSVGGVAGQGAGGADRVTLAAAPDSLLALVETWDAPPETAPEVAPLAPLTEAMEVPTLAPDMPLPNIGDLETVAMPSPDQAPPRPDVPQPAPSQPELLASMLPPPVPVAEAPQLHRPAPQAPVAIRRPPSLDLPDMATPISPHLDRMTPPPPSTSPLAVATSPRPASRPDRPARPNEASTAQPARVASGAGTGATAGAATAPSAPGLSNAQRQTLMSQWGGQILRRIERNRPRFRGTGQVVLRLSVTPAGQLAGLSIARSSGDPALDQAAISAAQRAGRLPSAPDGLTDAVYGFSLPIAFR